MDFLLGKINGNFSKDFYKVGDYYIQYIKNNCITKRELFIDSPFSFIIGDVNPSFLKAIEQNTSQISIEKCINHLNNGYILYADKLTKTITLYTDIFGFYHIFYCIKDEHFSISSDFKALFNYSNKQIDDFAILDIVLFNYTLFERTLVSDIKRLIGGTKVTWDGVSFKKEVCFNFAKNFRFLKSSNQLTYKEFAKEISKGIQLETIPSIPVQLTMTGGFDSRALLAACKNLNFPINAITYGQEGNIEIETLKPFLTRFVNSHRFLLLDKEYVKSIPQIFQSFIKKNTDNPAFHSLIEFEYCCNNIPVSNLILGFMGGELINGQSLGAQVTFTGFAANLLLTSTIEELKINFLKRLKGINFLNYDYAISISDSYLMTLQPYFHNPDNANVLQFIINEEYAKFFGAVNKVFKNKQNIIVPFMSYSLLELLLNSDISFLKKKLFTSNPFANFKSKLLYAKSIQYLCPALSDTRFDRLYKVKDLVRFYLLPKAVLFYFLNHFFRKNNKMFTSTTRYDLWYRDIAISRINLTKNELPLFDPRYSLSPQEYANLNILKIREILRFSAIFYAKEEIN